MKTIAIEPSIRERTGQMLFLNMIFSGIVVEPSAAFYETALEDVTRYLKEKFREQPLSADPVVSAVRRMYRSVGWEPTKYRPSSEALMRRIIRDKGLYRVNNVVDLANLVSARYHIPMGLYDEDKIHGNIVLDVGREGEFYDGISRKGIRAEGKLILRDEDGVFGNPTADSARTAISENTKKLRALFFCPPHTDAQHIMAIRETMQRYFSECGKQVDMESALVTGA